MFNFLLFILLGLLPITEGKGHSLCARTQMDNCIDSKHLYEDRIIEDPVREYVKYQKRLQEFGLNASFPEFKSVVDHLISALESESIKSKLQINKELKIYHEIVLSSLTQLTYRFKMDAENYPYPMPVHQDGYPYLPTIQAIQKALEFLDVIARTSLNNKLPPLYHFDRYYYHTYELMTNKEIILFPTTKNLTFEDLIRIRACPIFFVAVSTFPVFADGHHQSPLDFFIHDFNHNRRMLAYTNTYLKENEANTQDEKIKKYHQCNNFITKMLQELVHESNIPDDCNKEFETAVRRIIRAILFDLFHESAINADKESILIDLARKPGEPSSFEHIIIQDEFNAEQDLEKVRIATGNLLSGTRYVRKNQCTRPIVRYFFDKGNALLTNVYQESANGFYDHYKTPNEEIIPFAYRKPEYVLIAAKRLYEYLDAIPPTDDELYDVITSRKGIEDYTVINDILKDVESGKTDEYKQY